MSLLNSIGNTPLVELRKIVPPDSARVLVKLESANPTGSMKDRMARTVIEGAEQTGKLQPGGTVVGGNEMRGVRLVDFVAAAH